MTTNIKPGQKIRIAVPLTPGDDTPIAKREIRISTVEQITENGIIHETEGSVRVDRIGMDWEPLEAEDSAANLVVVRLASGPILASVVKVTGQLVNLYSDMMVPPGPLSVPASACGKCWDWLRGRTVGDVFMTLGEQFDPPSGKSAPPQAAIPGQAAADAKPKKKRGPKPRDPSVTGATEVLPAAPAPTVSASDPADEPSASDKQWKLAEYFADDLQAAAGRRDSAAFKRALHGLVLLLGMGNV